MVLTGEQISRLSELLDRAVPLDKEGRRRWLQGLPPEYHALMPALRRALLSDDLRAGIALKAALPTMEDTHAPVTLMAAGLRPGRRIGPYELVCELGAGGTAVVWLALRAEGALRREVALKLPLMSCLRRDLAERFERECEILSGLDHPNIARMYEAGVSPDGLPYLALEYVRGEALTRWCDRQRLGVAERLQLFLQALDAVQYAHDLQVVHRDLKPSNLLVTESGQVRLLDFGVARMLDDGQAVTRTDLTQVYGRMLTPDYASPEQLQGERIGPASDIYALGLVLYELLAGDRPYRIRSEPSAPPLEQAIREAQIRKPSTQVQAAAAARRGTTPQQLVRVLQGDLDAVVLKAVARRPADRYRGAVALASDLKRFLGGQPVEARSGRMVRLGRLLERHPFAAATVVTSIAAALGFGIQHQEAWVPAARAGFDEAATRARPLLMHLRPDQPPKPLH